VNDRRQMASVQPLKPRLGLPARVCAPGAERREPCVRAIRTGQLHALLRFDLRPIDVVVDHGSCDETWF
jgi:hypothetical protein